MAELTRLEAAWASYEWGYVNCEEVPAPADRADLRRVVERAAVAAFIEQAADTEEETDGHQE